MYKFKIKKYYLAAFLEFICLVSGFSLANIFLKTLIDSGWYGLILVILFILSLVWLIDYFLEYSFKVKMAKEVAEEVTSEKLKTDPGFFEHTSSYFFRNQIESHLLEKLEGEEYVFFGKKAKIKL